MVALKHKHNYIKELENMTDKEYSRHMTPGAKHYFKRVWVGYIILALSGVFGTWAVTNHVDKSIRRDINSFAQASCLSSRAPDSALNKYNKSIEVQIQNLREARKIYMERGDDKKVNQSTEFIIRLQGVKLHVPNEKECSAPILKE